ncbi:MAG: Na+/H+ antiporter NhaC family protein [Termitinemataceae bacterium]|nr:MAG: Na+/H+ antiporter NhaC family protein [Termitinemataceae bacterium]
MGEVVEEAAEVVLNLGLLSLLPIFVIFAVSIITKRSLFGMFCGVLTGCILITCKMGGNLVNTLFEYLQATFGDDGYQWLTVTVLLFGILIALLEVSGAVAEFGHWAGGFLKTKKQTLLGALVFGIIVFVDDYLSNLAVGSSMRKLTDRQKIPRSQLAFIVLVMAGPISQLIPISSWTGAYTAIFTNENVFVNGSAITAYLHSIPFIFYAWVMLVVCLLQVLGVLPKMGMIKRDYKRAEESGKVFPEGGATVSDSQIENEIKKIQEESESAKKPYPFNFLIPIVVTVAAAFLTQALNDELDIQKAALWGCVAAIALYLIERKLTLYKSLDACFQGVTGMAYVLVLIVLAFTVNAINKTTGMPDFVINAVKPIMSGSMLPLAVFLVCAAYGFFTGACWDLAMIIMPIVVPLALATGIDPVIAGAAVFSGSLFGNVFCPYSDGVILTSQACQIRPIDTMFAIAPYMIIGGIITAILYLITGIVVAV